MPNKTAEPKHFWSKELTPYRILKLCAVVIAFIFLVISYGHGFFWINAIIWAITIFVIFYIKPSITITLILIIAIIGASMYVSMSAQNNRFWSDYLDKLKNIPTPTAMEKDGDDSMMMDDEIYIEAEHGTLSDAGEYSYVGESARGNEAYLGDGGATVIYSFENLQAATYDVMIRIHDDGVHEDGSRDATFEIGTFTLPYEHTSENTDGWKWVSIGTVTLSEGTVNVTVTKNETTSAAFVMDAFKLVPVKS